MKKIFTLLFLAAMSIGLFAEKQVSGVVVYENGEPVIGASIQAKGTTQGTISDYDGKFEMEVPESVKTLIISYVGMTTQEVDAGKNLKITMSENSEVIQEVVVTGYGNVSKGGFTGSVETVKAEDIEKKNPSDITKALAGESAGVQVVTSSGQPGTIADIRIRGIGSISASSAPLYVVDGIPLDAGSISSIDPGDIASTTILKDATATSLYGSRGANGVIVITTKKGSSNGDEGKIEVDVKAGANMRLLPMYDVIDSPEDYVVLASLEVDVHFNCNVVVGSDGMITGAQGGHPDTAQGAKCAIVICPLLQGRIPAICTDVTTVTTPGESIDVVVTDYGVAVNPARQDILQALKEADCVPLKTIEELRDIAYSIVGEPDKVEFEDRIVGIIEARDGTIMDVVRQIKEI